MNTQSDPLVSIVMPAHNAERFLATAVNSVIAQSYSRWELLIVDDASTDGTRDLARKLAREEPRIRIIQLEENQGAAAARNSALEAAQGRYIAFLDSDDLWYETKLARQVTLMENEGVLISCASYHRLNENGAILGTVHPPERFDYRRMLRTNHIGNLTGIYNAEVLGIERFCSFGHEDYVAWLELIKRAGEASAIREPLAGYRVHQASLSARKLEAAKWQWTIYRESQGMGFLRAAYCLVNYVLAAFRKRF